MFNMPFTGGILNDKQITELAMLGMIEPFDASLIRQVENPYGTPVKAISHGLSSFGYDLTLEGPIRYRQAGHGELDPKRVNEDAFQVLSGVRDVLGIYVVLPAHTFALGSSKETFRMPRGVTGIAVGKSTYLRCGVWCPISPLEAGWEGKLTIEIANVGPDPVRVYLNEGITQIVFFQGLNPGVAYGDRPNNYQGQTTTTLAKV